MKEIIVFDVDGVLVYSIERSIASLCGIISRHGLDLDYDVIIKNQGHSFAHVLIPALAQAGNWPDYKKDIVLQESDDFFHTTRFSGPPHLKEKLQELKKAGHKIGVATNRSSKMMEKGLLDLDMDRSFFDFLHSADCGICKPDPRVFEPIFRCNQDRKVVFVGDSIVCDLPAARGCQPIVKFVGITSIIHTKEDFVKAGVPESLVYDSVIDYIDEILVSQRT